MYTIKQKILIDIIYFKLILLLYLFSIKNTEEKEVCFTSVRTILKHAEMQVSIDFILHLVLLFVNLRIYNTCTFI